MTTKPTPGRPRSARGRPRSARGPRNVFALKLSTTERETIEAHAAAAGLTITEYTRAWAIRGPELLGAARRLVEAVDGDTYGPAVEAAALMVAREIRELPAAK